MDETIRNIRKQLRLAMNGVLSTSMRNKGIHYHLNFGVPFLEVKQIAQSHTPNRELALSLWKEDVREFKLLAPMLMPPAEITIDEARSWILETKYSEIQSVAESVLYCKIPESDRLISLLLEKSSDLKQVAAAYGICAYKLFFNLPVSDILIQRLVQSAVAALSDSNSWNFNCSVVRFLKQYGRQSETTAHEVMERVRTFSESNMKELKEVYDDLNFEFEYYFEKKES